MSHRRRYDEDCYRPRHDRHDDYGKYDQWRDNWHRPRWENDYCEHRYDDNNYYDHGNSHHNWH